MKTIKRAFQLKLKAREVIWVKKIVSALVIPVFVVQMVAPTVIWAGVSATESAASIEAVEDEEGIEEAPVVEEAPVAEEEPVVEEAPVAEKEPVAEPEVEEPATEESESDLGGDAAPAGEVAPEVVAEEIVEEPAAEEVVEDPAAAEPVAPVSEETPVAPEEEVIPEQPAAAPATMDTRTGSAGNQMTADSSTITLQAITPLAVNPSVTSTTPANNATNVSIGTQSLMVIFNTSVNCDTVNESTILLRDANNKQILSMGLYCGGASAEFVLSDPLVNNMTYTGTVVGGANGVKSATGNLPMLSDYTWSFATVALNDSVAPIVSSTNPADGATNVPLNTTVIQATFSEPLQPSSVNYDKFIVRDNLNNEMIPMSIGLSNGNTRINLSLTNPLENNKTYTATIIGGANGVKDLAGNPLAANYVWSFSAVPLADAVAPSVLSTSPTAGAADVPLNLATIQVNFDEQILASSFTSSNFFVKDDLNNDVLPISQGITNNGTTLNLYLASELSNNRTYTATVVGGATGIKDLAGNALAANYAWSFSTTFLADAVAPTVVSSSPTGNNVPLNTLTIQANFSEPILASSADYPNFFIKDNLGVEVLPMGIGLSNGGTTLSLQLPELLELNKTYNVTVTTGIKDLAGNPLAANYVWSFSTNPTGAICQTTADTSGDGIISNAEILSYISAWKSGSVSNLFILQAVQYWKAGTGC